MCHQEPSDATVAAFTSQGDVLRAKLVVMAVACLLVSSESCDAAGSTVSAARRRCPVQHKQQINMIRCTELQARHLGRRRAGRGNALDPTCEAPQQVGYLNVLPSGMGHALACVRTYLGALVCVALLLALDVIDVEVGARDRAVGLSIYLAPPSLDRLYTRLAPPMTEHYLTYLMVVEPRSNAVDVLATWRRIVLSEM